MYDDIVPIYSEIFPLNEDFLQFLPGYLGPAGSAVLDLGCGPGDYVDLLQQRGWQAVGIDSSPAMISHAQREKQGTFYPYGFEDINRLEGSFHCIYSIGNSLSYLAPELRPGVLAALADMHEPGGTLILQVINWDLYLRSGTREFPVKDLSGNRQFHRRYAKCTEGEVIFHTEITRDGHVEQAWSASLYPLRAADLVDDATAAGYEINGLYGDYSKAGFDPDGSQALIVTARRTV